MVQTAYATHCKLYCQDTLANTAWSWVAQLTGGPGIVTPKHQHGRYARNVRFSWFERHSLFITTRAAGQFDLQCRLGVRKYVYLVVACQVNWLDAAIVDLEVLVI